MRTLLAAVALLACIGTAHAQSEVVELDDVTVGGTAVEICVPPAGIATGSIYACSCTNTHATVHIRWGRASVAANKGQQVRATASIEFLSRGRKFAISEGANVTLSCSLELK